MYSKKERKNICNGLGFSEKKICISKNKFTNAEDIFVMDNENALIFRKNEIELNIKNMSRCSENITVKHRCIKNIVDNLTLLLSMESKKRNKEFKNLTLSIICEVKNENFILKKLECVGEEFVKHESARDEDSKYINPATLNFICVIGRSNLCQEIMMPYRNRIRKLFYIYKVDENEWKMNHDLEFINRHAEQSNYIDFSLIGTEHFAACLDIFEMIEI